MNRFVSDMSTWHLVAIPHQALCDEHCIEASHGLGHALRVLEHVNKAKHLARVQNFKGFHARPIRLKQ